MALEMLIREAEGLTDKEILEVVRYAQFLKISPRNVLFDNSSTEDNEETIYRKPGLYKGGIKILDGFDDLLDDFEVLA